MKMKRLSKLQLSVLVLVGLWFTTASAFSFDPLREYSRVDLSKLQEQPKTYKNTDVKFKVYFHQIDNVWSPFFSPFSPSDYVAFSAWDHEKNIWKKKEMVNDFPFLFIKNGSNELNAVLTANKYDLLEVKGTVVSAFKSKPWVEVRHVDVLERKVFSDKQLGKFMLANEANRNGHPTVATKYFEKGLQQRALPKHLKAEVYKQLAINYFEASDYGKAIENIYQFREYSSEEDATIKTLLKQSKNLQNMSPQERNEYERKRMQSVPEGETGLLTPELKKEIKDPSRLKKKYQTLLSRFEQILDENQSLKTKYKKLGEENRKLVRQIKKSRESVEELQKSNKELKRKLTEAYQKNARLLARLRNKQEKQQTTETSEQQENKVYADQAKQKTKSVQPESDQLREKKLLSRIRTLKQRNRSLRSQITSLTSEHRKTRKELDRLKNQVNLETSSAEASEADRQNAQQINSSTSEEQSIPSGTEG